MIKQIGQEKIPSVSPSKTNTEAASGDFYAKLIAAKIDDLSEKIKKGEAVPSFQIGSRTFTIKEWEKFLKQFDSLQDAIRKMIEEEKEKREHEKRKETETHIAQNSGF